MSKEINFRIRIISGFLLLLGILLITRLYFLQIVHSSYYRGKAESQYIHTAKDLYSRGNIYFTTKDGEYVSAASIQFGYVLAINPTLINDPGEIYNKLATFLTMDRETFLLKAKQKSRTYIEIETELDGKNAEIIEVLNLPGVMLYRNQWRYYPGNAVSAKAIGFVGYSEEYPDDLHGKYGLERFYDEVLTYDDTILAVNFFAEIFSNFGNMLFDSKPAKTGSIVTTIEPTVARILDKILEETQVKYHSQMTGGIIMNPKTGAIYAMNTIPTYNLNDRKDATVTDFQNPLVENVYEFGSIIKALTMASGIDSAKVTPQSTNYDAGLLNLDGYTIKNYDGRGRGTVSMQEVLNQSLNTGATFVMQQMGRDKFRDYFLKLKIGSETGIDLPNEAQGLIQNIVNSPRDIEYATASYGQGIAMTPIATTRALATLGNGGYLITPHLVSKIEYQDGTSKDINYPLGEKVFESKTSETISRMLTTVADEALLHGKISMPHHSFAAKTGTAQMSDPKTGKYYEDEFLHSFFGYFPSYDPKFLIFLYTVDPKGVQYASGTLTEPFGELTKFLINYYDIPPDR